MVYSIRGSLLSLGNWAMPGKLAEQHFSKRHLIRGTPRCLALRNNALPRAFLMAVPCGALAALLRFAVKQEWLDFSTLQDVHEAWSSFSVLVTFLVVFRTSQSYTRFWEGCTSCHRMRAEWFDACSALIAFCRCSKAPERDVQSFQYSLIRLFSLLHGIALAEIEDRSDSKGFGVEHIEAFNFELLDPEGFDDASLKVLLESPNKPELLYQWLQCLIVENVHNRVLAAPAPLLTRSYQELANGMVAFHEALKISTIPFPLPYVQACDWMLFLHYVFCPLVLPTWVDHWAWAFAFCFIQIFILWALKFTASEIENPFGADANDLDRNHMQREMNDSLKATINPSHMRLPRLHRGRHEEMMAGNKGVNITVQSVVARMKAGDFRAGIQGSFLTVSEELASFASGASGSKVPSMMPTTSLDRVSEERMSNARNRVQFSQSDSMVNSIDTILTPESPSSMDADFLPLPSQQNGCGTSVVNTTCGDGELNLMEVRPQCVFYTDALGQKALAEIASDFMTQGSSPERLFAPTTHSREPPPDDEANYVRQPGQSGHLRGQRNGSSPSAPAFSASVQGHFTM